MRKSAKRPLSVKRNISVVHRDRERPLKIGQFYVYSMRQPVYPEGAPRPWREPGEGRPNDD
jgi:hypothetical protein